MLREFNHHDRVNSSIMMIPVSAKTKIWEEFTANPEQIMQECKTEDKWGDQGFIGSVTKPDLWQDIIPDAIKSYQ